jgi:hypothetical protein
MQFLRRQKIAYKYKNPDDETVITFCHNKDFSDLFNDAVPSVAALNEDNGG